MLRLFIVLLVSIILVFSCGQKQLKSGIDKSNFDTSVKPQDDFFQYANGTWFKNTEIPADRSRYGSFAILRDEAEKNLRTIIEESAKMSVEEDTDEQKVGDFYKSYMDSALIEKLGLKPLADELNRIEQVKTKNDLRKLFAHFELVGIQKPFGIYIDLDLKKSDSYITYLTQSGLGLPDRDYYFKEGEKFKDIREKYLVYIENILTLADVADADAKAKLIVEIEKKIAKSHWSRVENRDREKTYNKFEMKNLDELTPNFSWSKYYAESGISNKFDVIVKQPSFFKAFNNLLKNISIEDWKTYITWKLLNGSASLLSKNFVDLRFEFYGKTIRGMEKNRARWKRAVRATNGSLAEVVGKVYVKKYFKPEAKQRMVALVENLQKSFEKRLKQLDWMSVETKNEALNKLSKFGTKIGYPDKWKDYSKLVIKKDDLIGNFARSNQVAHEREVAKLGKPVDRDEWVMTPQTVNAGYYPPMNEVIFPAGILQPPFFNMEADDAVNYGAIGAAIGHEMTHGFDDQGRKLDGDGNLRDWWTEEDNKKFMKRAQVIIDQYDQYNPVDTMHVNGELTLGENIADLGGLTIAYYAYKMSLNGKESPIIDGFTGEQRFFFGFAQVWRSKLRDEEFRRRILTDPHSPGQYRCNGVASNMPEFYAAFDVKEGDPMYRPEEIRVKIW
jgi:predicted metalloendopeptidase